MRMLAVFVYAFLVSSVIHPIAAQAVWNPRGFMSPTKYCNGSFEQSEGNLSYTLSNRDPTNSFYILDYAGAGVVHLLGGIGGLVLSIAHKRADRRSRGRKNRIQSQRREVDSEESESLVNRSRTDSEMSLLTGSDTPERPHSPSNFWVWMYPKSGGPEHIEYSALGVLILWTTWFAFNCGSTESMSSGKLGNFPESYKLYHATAGRIAVNMILCAGAGGLTAILVASLVQLKYKSNMNANEVANGILSCLVAITGGCAFISCGWAPIIIGIIAVWLYHFGCWIEYRLDLPDSARVIPVHAIGGFWGLISTGIFQNKTYIKAVFGNLCFCREQDVPVHPIPLQVAYQLAGALLIVAWSLVTVGLIFSVLSLINVRWLIRLFTSLFFLNGCGSCCCRGTRCCQCGASGGEQTEYGDCLLTAADVQ